MYTTNYFNTLILASTDCAAKAGTVPAKPGTIAALQYEMVSVAPYKITSDDLLLAVEAHCKDVTAARLPKFREEFLSVPHACLRASPLVKTYGWGIHHDAEGRVALVGRQSREYEELVANPDVKKVPGMRSRRA
jgi:hypothetical protein